MILRPATTADLPALSQLAIDSFVVKFGALYSREDLAAFLTENLSEAAFAGDLADPTRLIQLADNDGELLAFCKVSLLCGFPAYARGTRVMELKQLYALAKATGMGIGGQLMDWALGEFTMRGADEVQLSVYAENYGAHRFYARYGFAKVADITFKVGEQLDPEFLYAKLLT